MTRFVIAILVTVFLCACDPPPQLCREWGVAVPDGVEVTGEIVEYHIADSRKVSAMCGFSTLGCAIPVAPGQWIIWSIDDSGVRLHEECHALYEIGEHGLEG